MAKKDFLEYLSETRKPLLGDGAMGTMLHARGASMNACFDELNLTDPAQVADVHRAYIEAGSEIIQTNTFGANRFKLAEHGLEEKLSEINKAGVELVRKVAEGSFKEVYIAGDMGPLGVRLEPYGRVSIEQAQEAFAEQAAVLCESGADLIIIETMTDLYEVEAAIRGARQACELPILASMTFTRDDRTLLGDTPEKVAGKIREAGAEVIGINCSGGPAQLMRILNRMQSVEPDAFYSVMPNAGWPEQSGGRIMYPAGPEYFGEYAISFWQAGAKIIGGCCGTTQEHIAAMRQTIDTAPEDLIIEIRKVQVKPRLASEEPEEEKSRLAQKLERGGFAYCVEMDPPRGLNTHKLIAGASMLHEAGADVINVADSPMARMRMSPWAVCDVLQSKVGIETTLHFPIRGRNLLRVQGDLLAAHALGIRNVFVVMGDPTSIGDYPDAMDNYDVVPSALIKLIKQGFNQGTDHSGADLGSRTSFFVGTALDLYAANRERAFKVLKRKIRNGADFVLTQPVYDLEKAQDFITAFESENGKLEIPLIVGILPLYNTRHASFLHNEVPGIIIPDAMFQRIEAAGKDSPKEGVQIAIEQVEQLREWGQGIYIMPPFNRFDMAAEIIEASEG